MKLLLSLGGVWGAVEALALGLGVVICVVIALVAAFSVAIDLCIPSRRDKMWVEVQARRFARSNPKRRGKYGPRKTDRPAV